MQGYNYLRIETKPLRCATSQGYGNLALEAQDRMSEFTPNISENKSPYYVYLIEQADEQFTKIGITNDPETRLSSLQTGNPQKLTLRYLLHCQDYAQAQGLEQAMHFVFAQRAAVGEWFCGSALNIMNQWELISSAILSIGNAAAEEVSLSASMRDRMSSFSPPKTQRDVIEFLQSNPDARNWPGKSLAEIIGVSEATVSRARAVFSDEQWLATAPQED